ncbi:MAG: glycosyltransferase, partial [Bacteroidetes bacterium]|nr:glycosyltransferase [Bacteroidota bacterium]
MSKLLSIITVTYNCAELIRPTLDSILKSKPDGLEYIVIDGASTDGTVDIIRSFGKDIDLIVSEPDSGIYNAMNNGLRVATGEYVLYINAGDLLYTNKVFPAIADQMGKSNSDIYFGDTMLMDNSGRELGLRSSASSRALPSTLNWRSLERGMVVSHQSFIVKRSIAPLYQLKYH